MILLGVLLTIAELLLFSSISLWLYWSYQHDDGLGWLYDTTRQQQFNTHAAFMLFGFIFLNGQGMLIYKTLRCCRKEVYIKIIHASIFVISSIVISLGFILVYVAQENVGDNSKPPMHFYSLHAWIGLSSLGLFIFQSIFGSVTFLILKFYDNEDSDFRATLIPIHRTFGLIIFSLAISTCLTGILQTARSRLSSRIDPNQVDYNELSDSGMLINMVGTSLICLAILMPYIIRIPEESEGDEDHLSSLDRYLKSLKLDLRLRPAYPRAME